MESAVKKEPFPELTWQRRVVSTHEEMQVPSAWLPAVWFRITHWETWDWRIKYILLAPVWLWFCLRARSFWFFTTSNPTLTFGGFDGERKSEMYAQLPPGSFPKSLHVSPATKVSAVIQQATQEGIKFPFAVKPDVGKMGFMFRQIHSAEQLTVYHKTISCDYIIQEWVDYPVEVSVFYSRMPGDEKGTITGFVRKDFLEVCGDGRSTVWELILNYPRVRFRLGEMKLKHRDRLQNILAPGEKFCLSPALNLSRGGRLISLEQEKDEDLLSVFDALSHYTGSFYYGRYDVKCNSIAELKRGKNFSILEYNGSGAEPHHVYGNGNTLWKACRILAEHWRILYRISRVNHNAGMPYWNFAKGWKFLRETGRHLSTLRHLDAHTDICSLPEVPAPLQSLKRQ